ncbi:TonB-dependent receptor [Cytophagaceae bacterium DM2B3-1]|uniref:TonB-dependent receptor n=1 Tax=Xanthocytophaga flava TaxID=3048013 RepID=A0ABT7CKV9_9BACT|nr:TonB-dependent receptor [Xanthocytophaga flavus]MDJ1494378.1 TonB-dependent receptor [Xanthocytophaga flavus]
MQKTLLTLCMGLLCLLVQAQSPTRVTIKGIIHDTAGAVLPAATVMLLQPKDSALVNFSRSDEKGSFEFKSVKNAPYILKISYVGYLPYQQTISVSATDVNDLGSLKVKPIAKELIEVVIKAARAPLSIKGDTIEYNAASFRVPPGSTVEDLLRRLPGIEVDGDGNIKAQGKDIKRVTVDGKTFFGDDPKAATKNLGAETLSKIQVYNDKSEQSKLTGVDDGKREKVMNLELKDEFKKGSFGKITLAGGTKERWAARGNYNRFNKKEQFSVIGYGNNINETGVNWEDYGEFKGNNSFNNYDNGDFGFGGGITYYFSDGGGILNNFDGRGFTKNAGAGVNYNYTHQKTKFSSSYFYNQTRLNLDQFTNNQTLLDSLSSFLTTDTTRKVDFRGNHSIGMRIEQMLDSSNTLIAKSNLRFSNSDVTDQQQQRRYPTEGQGLANAVQINNGTTLNSFTLTSAVIYRHRFKKKGRSFAWSGGFNASSSNGNENLNSLTRYLTALDPNDQIRALGQLNDNNNKQSQLKTSALFLEPLSKKFYWETFYNFSSDFREVSKDAFNRLQNDARMDSLSAYYTNQIYYNRLGTSLRYSYSGINISLGMAGLRYDLEGKFANSASDENRSQIKRNFTAWTPNVGVDIEMKNNMYFSTGYSLNVQAPQLNDLQPVVNNNNPYYIITGNPDLSPEKSHQVNAFFYKFDPSTFTNVNLSVNYSYYMSRVVYNQTINDSLVTFTRPENISGGSSFGTSVYAGKPIIKTKLTLNLSAGYNRSATPLFINGIRNETNNNSYNGRLGFTVTPNEKLLMTLSGNLNFNTINYSIEERQNQEIWRKGADVSLKWNFAKKFFLESNLNYTSYQNDRFNFNQDIPIFNASIRRLFLKDNKVEMRLAAFDILNKRRSITQNGSQNIITQQTALTLARYFMLSISYNVRGYSDKVKSNGGW